jgi:hypothetical protein
MTDNTMSRLKEQKVLWDAVNYRMTDNTCPD